MDKKVIGLNRATGHPLEKPLADFMEANRAWIFSQDGAVVSWQIVEMTWAPALMLVTEDEPAQPVRAEVNRRLVAAGFITNLPRYDRHRSGQLLTHQPARSIEILGYVKPGTHQN